MENASKALIMAGAVLIAILVISLGIMIFRTMSGTVKREANLDKQIITAFNAKITPYIGKNVAGSQVNALIQLARNINQKALNENDEVQRVKVHDGNGTMFSSIVDGKAVYQPVETGRYYEVTAKYDKSGLLTDITVITRGR